MQPTNLYDYYKQQGGTLGKTVAERFADPNFAAAAKTAGYTPQSYAINAGNADANSKILAALQAGKTQTTTGGTPPTNTGTTPTSNTGTTIADIFNPDHSNDQYYTKANQIAIDQLSGKDIVDTAAIRAQKIAEQQDRINALNQIYADQLARVKQQGVGRVGQSTALLASRGLTGSLRGEAIGNNVLDQNLQAEKAVDAEKNAAIQAILTEANNNAVTEAQNRREAIQAGAKSYLEFIKGQDERTQTGLNTLAGSLITQGIDPSTMDTATLADLAKKYNVTSGNILAAYKQAKQTYDISEEKRKADLAKEANASLPASAQEYEYAKKGGYLGTYSQYQNEDANRKANIARAGAGGGFSSGQINSTINSIAGSFDNEPAVKTYQTIAQTVGTVKNLGTSPTDDIRRVYAVAKVFDPNSAVREGEYKTVQDYATSLLQRQGLKAKRVFDNSGFLTQEARTFINNTLQNELDSSQKSYDNVYQNYQRRIEDAKAGKGNSLTNYQTNYSNQVPSKFDYLAPQITIQGQNAYLPRATWASLSGVDKDALLAEAKQDGYSLLIN